MCWMDFWLLLAALFIFIFYFLFFIFCFLFLGFVYSAFKIVKESVAIVANCNTALLSSVCAPAAINNQ